MRKPILACLIFAAPILVACPLKADDAGKHVDARQGVPPFIKKSKLKILYRFPVNEEVTGLRVASPDGREYTIWLLENDRYVLIGDLRDWQGNQIGRQAQIQTRAHSMAIARYARVSHGIPLMVSGGDKTLYVFADPNCRHCHDFYQDLKKAMEKLHKAGVTVIWTPVAILGEDSLVKAATMLYQGNAESVAANEAHDGSFKPLDLNDPKNRIFADQVRMNTGILMEIVGDRPSTPTLVLTEGDSDDGDKVRVHVGRPANLDDFLAP